MIHTKSGSRRTRARAFAAGLLVAASLAVGGVYALGPTRPGLDLSALKEIPIESRGRLRALDTFARETVLMITGESRFGGRPLDLILSWITFPGDWEREPVIWVGYRPLGRELGLEPNEKRISPLRLLESPVFGELVETADSRRRAGDRLDLKEKSALDLYGRLMTLDSIRSGEGLALLPGRRPADPWDPVSELMRSPVRDAFQGLLTSYEADDAAAFSRHAASFKRTLAEWGAGDYPSSGAMRLEVFYNSLRPFRGALFLYVAAMACLVLAGRVGKRIFPVASLALFAAGFLLHTGGIVLRCMIAGRPPVSNMYESVIWVSWGICLFALILGRIYRNRTFLMAAAATAAVGLFLADLSPLVLDPGIHPLVPVLRSNKWLLIHVLTITLSYAAFALGLGLAHIYLFRAVRGRSVQEPGQREISGYLYRSLQIGVVLLAAGTILGGVWANYSWGRFWGWDPKEVWALIALLGYLAVLHGRLAGWLKDFGLAVGSVIAFMGVVMAWYGVNFVLGAGLHSYGFGSGGSGGVLIYLVFELGVVALALTRGRRAQAV